MTKGPFWKIKTSVCFFPTWEPKQDCYEAILLDWNQAPPVFHFAYTASALVVFFSMGWAWAQGGGMGEAQLNKIFQFFFDPPGSPKDRSKDIAAFIGDLSKNGLIETVTKETVLSQYDAGGALIPMKYVKPKIMKHGKPSCSAGGAVVAYPIPRCCG